MKKYLVRKFVSSVGLLILISMVVFALVQIQPGNPYLDRLGSNVSPEQFEEILKQVGYYDPIWLKYGKWLQDIIRGDLGTSIKHGQPVGLLIKKYMAHSILLMSISFLLSTLIGVVIGLNAGSRKSTFKSMARYFSLLLMSMPSFLLGLLLIKWFAYDLKWLPSSGMYSLTLSSTAPFYQIVIDRINHMIMPVITLMAINLPTIIQFTISNVEKIKDADFVRTARAKGLSEFKILWKHIFKNLVVPLVALLSVQAPSIFSGAMVTETIFNYPGMGKLGFEAVLARDYSLIMGVLLVNAVTIVMINFLVDFVYILIDPRIRLEKEQVR